MAEKNKGGRPRIIKSAKEFDKKVDDYIARCFADEEPVTITGMALALGFVDKQSLYDYAKYDGFSYSVKRARTLVEHAYEKRLSGPAATGAIFALKNFDWTDKTQIDNISSDRSMSPMTLDELYGRIGKSADSKSES